MNRKTLGILAVVLAWWLAPAPADAASVKSVQSGSVTMSANVVNVGSPTFTAVDPAKSFIVCSSRTNSSNPSNRATCELTLSGAQVTISTGVANATQTVWWQVVEFDAGVAVQRGTAVFPTGTGCATFTTTSCNVTLSGVTTTKTFTLITERTTATDQLNDERWTLRAQLTTATNLALTRAEAGQTITVAWQIIQMDGASVQRGLATIGAAPANCTGGSTTSSCVVNITSVTTANSFLLFTGRAQNLAGVESLYTVRGAITSATQITFNRVGTTSNRLLAWEVVSLDDGTSVQRNTQAFGTGAGTNTANVGIAGVDTTASIPLVSTSGGAGTNTADLDDSMFTARLSAGNTLELTRAGTLTAAANVAWQVVTFFRCNGGGIANVSFSAANSGNGQVTLNWSSANPVVILRWAATQGSEAPFQGQVYAASNTIGAATVVFSGSASTFTDTGRSNGTYYFYKVYARTAAGASTHCYASGAGSNVNVKAVDPAAGNEQWSYMVAGGSALKPPTTGEAGTAYVASNASWIISLATSSGDQSWAPVSTAQPVQGYLVWTSLSAGGNALVFGGDQSGQVYAVDTVTGANATNWPVTLANADAVQAGVSIQIRAYSDGAFAAALPGTYDVVIAATSNTTGAFTTNNKVVARRSDSGVVLWTFNPCVLAGPCPQNVDQIFGQPWIDYKRNRLYVTSKAGAGAQSSLWVLDSLTGGLVISFALGHVSGAATQSFLDGGDTLWVINDSGQLYAIDLSPGTPVLKWGAPFAATAAIKGYPFEDYNESGRLYFSTSDGKVWCVQDGGSSASTPCSGWSAASVSVPGVTSPVVLDQIYVGTYNGGSTGGVRGVDIATGALGTVFTVGDGTKTVGDVATETFGEIFVGTSEGKVFKITLPLP